MSSTNLNVHEIVEINVDEAYDLGGGSGFVQDIHFIDKDAQRVQLTVFFNDPEAAIFPAVKAYDDALEEINRKAEIIENLHEVILAQRKRITKTGLSLTVADIVPGRRYYFPECCGSDRIRLMEKGAATVSSVDEDGYDTPGYAWVYGDFCGSSCPDNRFGLALDRIVFDITE